MYVYEVTAGLEPVCLVYNCSSPAEAVKEAQFFIYTYAPRRWSELQHKEWLANHDIPTPKVKPLVQML